MLGEETKGGRGALHTRLSAVKSQKSRVKIGKNMKILKNKRRNVAEEGRGDNGVSGRGQGEGGARGTHVVEVHGQAQLVVAVPNDHVVQRGRRGGPERDGVGVQDELDLGRAPGRLLQGGQLGQRVEPALFHI